MSTRGMHDIAVAGGGVVGAAAALALARDGWDVALVETRVPTAWRAAEPDLRVVALAPDAMSLFDRLGIGERIRESRVQPYRRMEVWDAGGGGKLVFDADRFGRSELGWIVENALLVDRLWQALQQAGVTVHAPVSVTGYEAGDAADTLRLDDGQRLRARLVVAADGGASPLRQMAGIEAPAYGYGQSALVAFVSTSEPHQATCYQRFLPGGPLAFLPFADGRSSIVWTLPTADAEAFRDEDADMFRRRLTDAVAGRLGEISAVSERVVFPLQRRLASAQIQGRLAVIGDAAHVVHPLAGQGVNLGLRDVASLCDVLRPLASNADDPARARLTRWARERRSANARAAYAFEAINRGFSSDAMLPVLVRGPLLGWAGRMAPLQHALWREAAGV